MMKWRLLGWLTTCGLVIAYALTVFSMALVNYTRDELVTINDWGLYLAIYIGVWFLFDYNLASIEYQRQLEEDKRRLESEAFKNRLGIK